MGRGSHEAGIGIPALQSEVAPTFRAHTPQAPPAIDSGSRYGIIGVANDMTLQPREMAVNVDDRAVTGAATYMFAWWEPNQPFPRYPLP